MEIDRSGKRYIKGGPQLGQWLSSNGGNFSVSSPFLPSTVLTGKVTIMGLQSVNGYCGFKVLLS